MPAVPGKALSVVLLAAVLGASGCAVLGIGSGRSPLTRLAELYEDGRYFELRTEVARLDWNPAVEMEFFRGAVAAAFNRLDAAAVHLRRYGTVPLDKNRRPLAKEAGMLLADVLRRQGRYGRAAEALDSILDRFGPVLPPGEKAGIREQRDLWASLAGVPPQTVEVGEDTTIRMAKRLFPVGIGNRTPLFGYDTGSSLSIMYRSLADELGLTVSGPTIRVQTTTGAWIDGRVLTVPEMKIGAVRVRNAVFLVLPDEMFADPHPGFGDERRGLLGAPVLVGFREFTETRDGLLIIPAVPAPRPLRNLCLSGYLPIVDVVFRGNHLPFFLDTGAATTHLHPPFIRRHGGDVRSRSRARKATLSGVGSAAPVSYHVMREFAFRTGGRDIVLRGIAAYASVTNSNTRRFHGTLGLDVLAACSRLTVNTDSMSFVLE